MVQAYVCDQFNVSPLRPKPVLENFEAASSAGKSVFLSAVAAKLFGESREKRARRRLDDGLEFSHMQAIIAIRGRFSRIPCLQVTDVPNRGMKMDQSASEQTLDKRPGARQAGVPDRHAREDV